MPNSQQHISSHNATVGAALPDSVHATDSTATDSAALRDTVYVAKYLGGFPDSTGNDSAWGKLDELPVMEVPQPAAVAHRYTNSPLQDTGAMLLFLLGVFGVIVSYRTGYKYIENFAHNMFSVRRRENLFDDSTINETRIMTALIANTCIQMGLLAFYAMTTLQPQLATGLYSHVFMYVGIFTAMAAAFFLAQLALYALLGYVFGRSDDTHTWISGFTATQSLLGLLLMPVVCIIMVYPSLTMPMLWASAGLYAAARLVFVLKGWRIFFSDFSSTLYFILYLCSVEIIPPLLTALSAVALCTYLQS